MMKKLSITKDKGGNKSPSNNKKALRYKKRVQEQEEKP